MNLTWEAYKQAEAKKPQSQLLDEWHDKTSFSEDESPPEELVRILESNQSTQANIIKLEQEFWNREETSGSQDLVFWVICVGWPIDQTGRTDYAEH